MEFLDARRLTGPNLLFDVPAAVLDIACDSNEAKRIAPLWEAEVRSLCTAIGWSEPAFAHIRLEGGLSLAFTIAIDQLYAASETNEWAYQVVAAQMTDTAVPDRSEFLERIIEEARSEANPELLAIKRAANAEGVTLLWDDDEASLGMGYCSKTWPIRELAESPDWAAFDDVPVALVTGTNGKTTTVRLAKHILRGAQRNVGISSTDWIAVNESIVDRDDWSGPGGARAVLRNNDVEVAILESARGGLLRRGLGVDHATVSLITNIAEDHLGDFGSRNLAELLNIKWIVSRAVAESGTLVLNADDPLLVAKAADYPGLIDWFSLDADNPNNREHVANGSKSFVLAGDVLSMRDSDGQFDICKASEIPITMGGAARHNIANALAAAALTWRLGASLHDIAAGLKSLSQEDNPGRCNLYEVDGKQVLVDFAHNPHAMRALFDMAGAVPARRRVLCFSQAGDRPDALIEKMTRDAFAIGLDRVIVSELAKYHRGREHGEVYGVIRRSLLGLGLGSADIAHFESELESFNSALEWAEAGDLIIMLALGGSDPIVERLRELGVS